MNEKGFTVIELMVSVAIIALLTTIVVMNANQSKSQLSLSRVAYAFGQNVRKAQGMALSSIEYGVLGVNQPVKGYGVYVDTASNKQYSIYADNAMANPYYDAGIDYLMESVDFSASEPGIIIKQITNVPGNVASIDFSTPYAGIALNPAPAQNVLEVVFAIAADSAKTKTVSINTAGLVEIK